MELFFRKKYHFCSNVEFHFSNINENNEYLFLWRKVSHIYSEFVALFWNKNKIKINKNKKNQSNNSKNEKKQKKMKILGKTDLGACLLSVFPLFSLSSVPFSIKYAECPLAIASLYSPSACSFSFTVPSIFLPFTMA